MHFRILDIITEYKKDGFHDISAREIRENLSISEVEKEGFETEFEEAIEELLDSGEIKKGGMSGCNESVYRFD